MHVRSYRLGTVSLAIINAYQKAFPTFTASDVVREALRRLEKQLEDDYKIFLRKPDALPVKQQRSPRSSRRSAAKGKRGNK